MMTFAKRCAKEILRDPLNLFFGLGFPLVLLLLLSALQANIPVSLFEINTLTPGITVFGLSFMTLFSATLVAKDRGKAPGTVWAVFSGQCSGKKGGKTLRWLAAAGQHCHGADQ